MKVFKKLIVMLILSVFLISTVIATANAASIPKTDKQIEAKEKVAKVKVTFNANGGKIGSKKTVATSVKKGAKLKKLAATPKRTGFTFQGWFSKKSGGKKITKNTKVSKKVTYYARWSKKGSTSTNTKLIGSWWSYIRTTSLNSYASSQYYYFHANGRFQYFETADSAQKIEGKYLVSNGKIYFKEMKECFIDSSAKMDNLIKFWDDMPKWKFDNDFALVKDNTIEFELGSDSEGKYLKLPSPDAPRNIALIFRKKS